MLFLANLSGCHAKIPTFSLLASIKEIISLKIGLPGALAVLLSMNSFAITRFSFRANSCNSVTCASIESTCLSSSSVDLRAYKKYFIRVMWLSLLGKPCEARKNCHFLSENLEVAPSAKCKKSAVQ
ncbi:hypothetical protein HN748_06105 [Candidatus Peregrinibacteria bacterium]|nr:hypothetical protein [Candidatus Peregrinibacteria bacterium]MBT7484201.1 hypothetical protein [Candidatus Peregrinibacteria bacterium]MBT7703776.1 hypothetical protein [Candidatus Peregrinibacteria bacterium]